MSPLLSYRLSFGLPPRLNPHAICIPLPPPWRQNGAPGARYASLTSAINRGIRRSDRAEDRHVRPPTRSGRSPLPWNFRRGNDAGGAERDAAARTPRRQQAAPRTKSRRLEEPTANWRERSPFFRQAISEAPRPSLSPEGRPSKALFEDRRIPKSRGDDGPSSSLEGRPSKALFEDRRRPKGRGDDGPQMLLDGREGQQFKQNKSTRYGGSEKQWRDGDRAWTPSRPM